MSRLDFIHHVDCSRNKTAVIPLRPCLESLIENREKRCGRQPCLWKITRRGRTCGNEKSSEITDSSVVSFLGFTAWPVSAQLPRNLTKIARDVPRERSPIISDTSRTSIGYTGISTRCIVVESWRLDLSARYEYSEARAVISYSSFGTSV